MALDNNEVEQDDEDSGRELTLSTTSILGIFFCLALAFAAVFGLGYTVGRKSVPSNAPDLSQTGMYGNKPPAGAPAIQSIPGYLSKQDAANANSNATDNKVYVAPQPAPTTATAIGKTTVTVPMSDSSARPAPAAAATAVPVPLPPPAPAPAAAPVPVPSGSFVVQIAAVSHQEDAELLIADLRKRGYIVTIHTEGDKLIHVQMGPFGTRKDADAMRQRLLAAGYNAIIK